MYLYNGPNPDLLFHETPMTAGPTEKQLVEGKYHHDPPPPQGGLGSTVSTGEAPESAQEHWNSRPGPAAALRNINSFIVTQ